MRGFLNRFLTDFRFVEDKSSLNQYVEDRVNIVNRISTSFKKGCKLTAVGIISILLLTGAFELFNAINPEGTLRTILFLCIAILVISSVTLFFGIYNIIIALLFKNK